MSKFHALQVGMIQTNSIDCETAEEVKINIDASLAWIDKACTAYPELDLLVFPECGIQGGHPKPDSRVAFKVPGPEMQVLLDKCRERNVWACFNFLEDSDGKVYNTSIIANDKGEIALKYRKVNTFVPKECNYPGSEFKVCKGPKGAVFGIMTCYDGDFPEVARELSYMGANVLLRPTSYMEPYSIPWEFTNRARAYESMAYVIAVNRAGTGDVFTCFGNSVAVDYDGRVMIQAPAGIDWMTKVEVYPELVDQLRKERKTVNHLYNLKHRGFSAVEPEGLTNNPYSSYRDWK